MSTSEKKLVILITTPDDETLRRISDAIAHIESYEEESLFEYFAIQLIIGKPAEV